MTAATTSALSLIKDRQFAELCAQSIQQPFLHALTCPDTDKVREESTGKR